MEKPVMSKMGRTESCIVQVAPAYENEKNQEMQAFGWNLQGSQEIHEEGDSEGRPAYFSNSYIVKTKVKHYVKLHFVRSLDLPNLNKIKQIETEYFALLFPQSSPLTGPIIMMGFSGIGIISAFGMMNAGAGLFLLIIYGGLMALGWSWLKKRLAKRKQNTEIVRQSFQRKKELRDVLTELGYDGSSLMTASQTEPTRSESEKHSSFVNI